MGCFSLNKGLQWCDKINSCVGISLESVARPWKSCCHWVHYCIYSAFWSAYSLLCWKSWTDSYGKCGHQHTEPVFEWQSYCITKRRKQCYRGRGWDKISRESSFRQCIHFSNPGNMTESAIFSVPLRNFLSKETLNSRNIHSTHLSHSNTPRPLPLR